MHVCVCMHACVCMYACVDVCMYVRACLCILLHCFRLSWIVLFFSFVLDSFHRHRPGPWIRQICSETSSSERHLPLLLLGFGSRSCFRRLYFSTLQKNSVSRIEASGVYFSTLQNSESRTEAPDVYVHQKHTNVHIQTWRYSRHRYRYDGKQYLGAFPAHEGKKL
jgi:hypothetical protein